MTGEQNLQPTTNHHEPAAPSVTWQVYVNNELFDGDFEMLILVASKGRLQPQDKVRCSGGDWIEAQQVPELHAIFLELGTLPLASPPAQPLPQALVPTIPPQAANPAPQYAATLERICFQHPDQEGRYYCGSCQVWRCKQCVRRYEEVGVCADCGTLCVKSDAFKEQVRRAQERELTFSEELMWSVIFPFRRPIVSTLIFLTVWLVAAAGEGASDLASNPPFEITFLGPMKNIGFLGCALGFFVMEYFSFGYLMLKADGKESRSFSAISQFFELFEPILFFFLIVFIGLFPLVFHVYLSQLQAISAILMEADPSKLLKLSIWHHLGTVCFSLWALMAYPMLKVVAATKKSLEAMINPFMMVAAWVSLKVWLIPAFAISAAVYLMAVGFMILAKDLPGSVGISAAAMTCASLSSAAVIGTAIHRGWHSLDIDQDDPEVFSPKHK